MQIGIGTRTETGIQNTFMLVPINFDRRILLKKIMDEQNFIQDTAENTEEAFQNYFTKLFTITTPSSNDIAQVSTTI